MVNGTRTTYELAGDELIYTYTTFIYNRTRVQKFKKLPTGWKMIRAWLGEEKRSLFISPLGKRFPSHEDVEVFISKGKKSKRVEKENDTSPELSEKVKKKRKRMAEKNRFNLRKTILEQEWIYGTKKPYLREELADRKKGKENELKKSNIFCTLNIE